MSKCIVIGDIHGHTSWENIINKESYDKVIFLGDYFDSFSNPKGIDQVNNFKNILSLKKENPDKVIILYGNHDHSYLNKEMCSGYKIQNQIIYEEVLKEAYNNRYIQPIYIENNIIFSHAGVSKYWLSKVAELNNPEHITFENVSLDKFNFNYITGYNPYGDTISQSPIWIRPRSLLKDKIEGYRQIVGHTHMKEPYIENDIWFNDLLPNYFIIIEDNNINFKKIKNYE